MTKKARNLENRGYLKTPIFESVEKLVQIFHNFTLHDKQRGYLRLQQCKDLLWELDKLIDTPPDEVPE